MGFPIIDMTMAFVEIDERLIALGWINKQDEYRDGNRTGRCRVFIKSERFERWAIAVLAHSQGKTVEQIQFWYNNQPEYLRYSRVKQRLPFDSVLPLLKNLRDVSEGQQEVIEAKIVKAEN